MGALQAEMEFIGNLMGWLFAELKDDVVHDKLEDDIIHDKLELFLHNSRRVEGLQNRVKLVTPFFDPLAC